MLRTYLLQNKDWFANSDNPFSRLGEMDSEIAELRTMTKVTRLRKQIECREEGAWMVVKDIPDESAPSGSRKVTAYGRTRRSVTRSVSSNAEFGNSFPEHSSLEPLIQHPTEEEDKKEMRPSTVEITEVFDEPVRMNVPEEKPQTSERTSHKKTSVVNLGKGNLVLIDPEDESNFYVTGISKGKVADVVSTLEKSSEKKPKKVGFCKTEVHFAPDSGKINIVETDEKPPPTQVYRKKKRSRTNKNKQSNCLPKHYFGEVTDFCDDSNLSNESDKEESRLPLTFAHNIEVLPQVKQIFPTFEKTIKSESKDVKYRYSSPEKNDSDLEIEKFHLDEKDFFRKLKQPSFRDRFLKETESLSEEMPSASHSGMEDVTKPGKPKIFNSHSNERTINGLISRNHSSEVYSKTKFSNLAYSNTKEESNKSDLITPEPELRYTELFKVAVKNTNDQEPSFQDPKSSHETNVLKKSEEDKKSAAYGHLNKQKLPTDEKYDLARNISRIPIDQDIKTDVTFLSSMSPKLKNLIQNSVEHEFQLRQKQILQKRNVEKKITIAADSNKIKSSVHIRMPSPEGKEDGSSGEIKLKPTKSVTHVRVENGSDKKHEFQLKREQITKKLFSEPIYDNKEFEFKEIPYLLNEEPVPAPREKVKVKQMNENSSREPPKPKPRTIVSTSTERKRSGQTTSRQSKTESSTLSRRVRSRENLVRGKEGDRNSSSSGNRSTVLPVTGKDEGKSRKLSTTTTRIEGGIQRLTKSSNQGRKTVRGEPLRSFEKVSNGWVGHCVVPTKHDDKTSSKVTITTKVYSNKALAHQSSHHTSGVRKSTQSSTLKSNQSSRSDISKGTKQFSLSKEHLSSAKLVKELSPRKSTKTKSEVKITRPRTTSSKEGSYRRVRRDSNDSVIQADEEVRAYMFNSRPKK